VLWATTSNLACRRAAFDRVGGFDPDTPTVVGGEDVDFGVRLCEVGYVVATNPDARVLHARDHITKLRPGWRRSR
jgi:GT2 family glycosyltransferase